MKTTVTALLLTLTASTLFAVGIIEFKDPVETARDRGDLDTFVTVLDAAGLSDELRTGGPYTFLAPSEEAFAALPEGLLEHLLGDAPTLRHVMLYHIAAGDIRSREISGLHALSTLQGERVTVGGRGRVGGARIVDADIDTTNGVIHVIDAVLIPPTIDLAGYMPAAIGNIVEILTRDGRFNTFLTAIEVAGFMETLSEGGPFRVTAPIDRAFTGLPPGAVATLLGDRQRLLEMVSIYVEPLTDDTTIPDSDYRASNGVIRVVEELDPAGQ